MKIKEQINELLLLKDKLAFKIFIPNKLRDKIIWEENEENLNRITKINTQKEIISGGAAYLALSSPLVFPAYYNDNINDPKIVITLTVIVVLIAISSYVFIRSAIMNKAIRNRRHEIAHNEISKINETRENISKQSL